MVWFTVLIPNLVSVFFVAFHTWKDPSPCVLHAGAHPTSISVKLRMEHGVDHMQRVTGPLHKMQGKIVMSITKLPSDATFPRVCPLPVTNMYIALGDSANLISLHMRKAKYEMYVVSRLE